MRPGDYFTSIFQFDHDENLILLTLVGILMNQLLQFSAHDTTAVLSWHVQKIVAIAKKQHYHNKQFSYRVLMIVIE